MWPYIIWEFNQQGMVDSTQSIHSSARAGIIVRLLDYERKKSREAERLWIWEHLLKYRRIPPN